MRESYVRYRESYIQAPESYVPNVQLAVLDVGLAVLSVELAGYLARSISCLTRYGIGVVNAIEVDVRST